MTPKNTNILRAFMQGLTGAGLFRKLDYPGAPTEFVDSRTLAEICASGEIELNIARYHRAKKEKLNDDFRGVAAKSAEPDVTRVARQ